MHVMKNITYSLSACIIITFLQLNVRKAGGSAPV